MTMERIFFELIKNHNSTGYTIDKVPDYLRDKVQTLLDEEGLDGEGRTKQ